MRRAALAAVLASAVGSSGAGAAEEAARFDLTAYVVWGQDQPPADARQSKLPPLLEKLEAQLKKTAKKKHLVVETPASQGRLEADRPVTIKLPDGTSVEWKLDTGAKKLVVRQIVTPPQKDARPSEVVLKRVGEREGPRINVISRGEKVLLLVVHFTRTTQ